MSSQLQDLRSRVSFAARTLVLLAAAALGGCDASSTPVREPVGADPQALRLRQDVSRNRLWVLGHDSVSIHDNSSGRLLARVALPGWVYVDMQYACMPDLALDPSGTAFISSNVIPVIWRVDAVYFGVTRHEIALDADQDKDFGFSGLSVAPDGTLFAGNAIDGSLWRIDVNGSAAEKLLSYKPAGRSCELGPSLRATALFQQRIARSRPAQ